MAHSVTISVDDRTFAGLEDMARARGASLEEIVASTVQSLFEDPLLELAGTLDTGIPDLALHHDHYLADQDETVPLAVREELP